MTTKIRIAVGVWGEWHTRAMLTLNFASLLAPGNAPAMKGRYDLVFEIHTSEADKERIEASPEYKALLEYSRFEFRTIDDLITEDPIAAHKEPWYKATETARENGEFVCFYHPDIAWSDGSFKHIADLLDAGKKAIFKGFMRVVNTTFEHALIDQYRSADGTIRVSSRELVQLGLEHLHPLMPAYDRRSMFFPSHPEMIVWPVPGEGMHCRILAREMFLFDPSCVTHLPTLLLDSAPSPESVEMVGESDDLFAVSLAPLGKDIRWYDTPRRMTPQTFSPWLEHYDSKWNERISMTPINWSNVSSDSERWRRRTWASEQLIRRIRQCYRATWVWRMSTHMNMSSAACELLAHVIQTGFLYRIPDDPPVKAIIVPENTALEPHRDAVYELMAAGNEDRLLDALKDHMMTDPRCDQPIHEWLAPGEETVIETLSGKGIKIRHPGNNELFLEKGGRLYPYGSVKAADIWLYTSNIALDPDIFATSETQAAAE